MEDLAMEVRLSYWADIIKQCAARPQGMSRIQWMRDHDIRKDRFYYWQKKLRRLSYNQLKSVEELKVLGSQGAVTFAQVPMLDEKDLRSALKPCGTDVFSPDAVIRKDGMTIEISNTISPDLLGRMLEVVRDA